MLDLSTVDQLSDALQVTPRELEGIVRSSGRFYREIAMATPGKPNRPRIIVDVHEPLKSIHRKLFDNILKPKLTPNIYSHGGAAGRGILTNLDPHRNSVFYLATDLLSFFPSIRASKIERLFSGQLGCSPSVSNMISRLCTYKGCLSQGMIASPILADRLMSVPDRRIAEMCSKLSDESGSSVVYTRYVDDLTISARFPLDSGSTPRVVIAILKSHGFRINPSKQRCGRFDEGGLVTKLRINRGKLDVSPEYLGKLDECFADADSLSSGLELLRPFVSQQQVFGRIQFVGWVNPGRLGSLLQKYKSIDWGKVEAVAVERKLILTDKFGPIRYRAQ